jgi:hypothetical protein
MTSATLKGDTLIRLHEIRRFQVYRLERRRNRTLLQRLSRGLRTRFGR